MRSVLVKRGEVVRVGTLTGDATLYVGIEGGFDIQPILGSVSTNNRGWDRGTVNSRSQSVRSLSMSDHDQLTVPTSSRSVVRLPLARSRRRTTDAQRQQSTLVRLLPS
jgi:allophanate hydrolase subunit 2